MSKIRIGIVANYNPKSPYHPATTNSLLHSANLLGIELDPVWIESETLDTPEGRKQLTGFHGLYCGPGSPYKSMNGALESIRFARENDVPFFGT